MELSQQKIYQVSAQRKTQHFQKAMKNAGGKLIDSDGKAFTPPKNVGDEFFSEPKVFWNKKVLFIFTSFAKIESAG